MNRSKTKKNGASNHELPLVAEAAIEDIVFRIKTDAFVDYIRTVAKSSDDMPVVERIAGDLLVSYAFDVGMTYQVFCNRDLARLGIESSQLRDMAYRNFNARRPPVGVSDLGTCSLIVADSNTEACTLLATALWQGLQKDVQGELICAVPHRSKVLFRGSDDTEAVQAMHVAAVELHQTSGDNHSLSTSLFVFRKDHWELYRTAEEAGWQPN